MPYFIYKNTNDNLSNYAELHVHSLDSSRRRLPYPMYAQICRQSITCPAGIEVFFYGAWREVMLKSIE